MSLEERMRENWFEGNLDNRITIAKEYAEERYKRGQYDLIVMIAQDMFNVGALSADIEYLAKLKKQLKSQLAMEVE